MLARCCSSSLVFIGLMIPSTYCLADEAASQAPSSVTAAPATGEAETEEVDDLVSKSRKEVEHYNIAKRLYADKQYSNSLNESALAYRMRFSPIHLYNIANCHRRLGNQNEAVKHYDMYLRLDQDPIYAAQRARAKEHKSELLRKMSRSFWKAGWLLPVAGVGLTLAGILIPYYQTRPQPERLDFFSEGSALLLRP